MRSRGGHVDHRGKTGGNPIHLLDQRRQTIELLSAKPPLIYFHLGVEHGRDDAGLGTKDVPELVRRSGRQLQDLGRFVERLVGQPFELGAVVENSRLVAYPIRCSSGSWRRKRRPISVLHMGELGRLSFPSRL